MGIMRGNLGLGGPESEGYRRRHGPPELYADPPVTCACGTETHWGTCLLYEARLGQHRRLSCSRQGAPFSGYWAFSRLRESFYSPRGHLPEACRAWLTTNQRRPDPRRRRFRAVAHERAAYADDPEVRNYYRDAPADPEYGIIAADVWCPSPGLSSSVELSQGLDFFESELRAILL